MRHFALINDLQTDVILEVLVSGAADTQVDPGLIRGDLKVPLAKHVVLSLLKGNEIAGVLLTHEIQL